MLETEKVHHARSKQGLSWRLMIAAFGANTIAYAGWYVQPEQLTALSGREGLGQAAASFVVSAEITTAALVSIILGFLVASRAPRLMMIAGLALVMAGHGFALFAHGYYELLASRIVAGFGEGLLWVSIYAAVALLDNPDRRYGEVNAATATFLAILVATVPYVSFTGTGRPVYLALVVTTAVLVPTFFPFLGQRDAASKSKHVPSVTSLSGLALVIVVALWNMAVSVTYALSEEIGLRTHAAVSSVDLCIAISLFGVIAGGGVAAWFGTRYGRTKMVAALAVIEVISAFTLNYWTTLPGFAISLTTVNFALYCILPYSLGLAAEIDRSGGSAAAVAGGFALGGGLAPVFGSYLVQWSGTYNAVAWAILIGSLMVLGIVRLIDPQHPAKSVRSRAF